MSEGRALSVLRPGRVPYAEALELQADLVSKRRAGEVDDTPALAAGDHTVDRSEATVDVVGADDDTVLGRLEQPQLDGALDGAADGELTVAAGADRGGVDAEQVVVVALRAAVGLRPDALHGAVDDRERDADGVDRQRAGEWTQP